MSLVLPTDLVFPLAVNTGDELTAYTAVEDEEQPITLTFIACYRQFSDRQNKAANPYLRYEGMELKTFRLKADCTFQAYDLNDAMNLLAMHFAKEDERRDLYSPNAPLEFVGEVKLGAEKD